MIVQRKQEEAVPIHKLHEECVTDSASLDFGIKKLEVTHKGKSVNRPPHRHDFYYVLFVKKGTGVHTIDFKTYAVQPCSVFFISPGQVHSLQLSEDVEGFTLFFKPSFYLINSNPRKVLDFPFFHTLSNEPTLYLDCINPSLDQTLNDIYTEYHTYELGRDNVIRALIDVLLVRLSRKYPVSTMQDQPIRLTYQMRELENLIDQHYKELRTLDDYAERMNVSPKHLNNLCKKALDKTVINLVHERIVTEAKRMLLFTDYTISQIAYELGYFDKSYFMRFFKKNIGETPETFRQSNRTFNIS